MANDVSEVVGGAEVTEAPVAKVAKYGKPTQEVLRRATFDLEPLDVAKTKREVRISYCVQTQVDENGVGADKVRPVWVANIMYTFEGMESLAAASHSTARGAVNGALRNLPGSNGVEAYAELNYEDAFFTEKWVAPKAVEPVVKYADTVTFNGEEVSLEDLRGAMEEISEDLSTNQTNAQGFAATLGKALAAVYNSKSIKQDAAKLTAFVRGEGLGDNAQKMPHLARLGSGQNAVVEALRFGQADDRLLAVVYNKLTSGKGLERLKSDVTKKAVNAAVKRYYEVTRQEGAVALPVAEYDEQGVETRFFNSEAAARFLRCFLEVPEGFNIATAQNLPWDELTVAADAAADRTAAEFLALGGKDFNPYNDAEFDLCKKAFVKALHAYRGSDLPAAHGVAVTVALVEALNAAEQGEDRTKLTAAQKLLHGPRASVLIAQAAAEIRKDLAAAEVDEKRKEVQDKVGDDAIVADKVRKAFASLSVIEAAAKLLNLVTTHEKWELIVAELGKMAKAKAAEAPKGEVAPVDEEQDA